MVGYRVMARPALSQTPLPMVPPQAPLNPAIMIAAGAVSGSLLGLIFSIIAPKLGFKVPKNRSMKAFAALGGAVGGAAGVGTAYLIRG